MALTFGTLLSSQGAAAPVSALSGLRGATRSTLPRLFRSVKSAAARSGPPPLPDSVERWRRAGKCRLRVGSHRLEATRETLVLRRHRVKSAVRRACAPPPAGEEPQRTGPIVWLECPAGTASLP